ncbi:GIN domain-containing protein [Sphingobacterium deserti]|uniref:Putative auto-transporter adhesin head GIN domain-containing protein n=1 Tax=Sphingobacterium deserti TaxID=1229276 RepID=A0A0B8T454_9SPHI|nr:DUF2807 domain-containing protein [Sphingobacterium deserti]KGE16171.1 hypothetical protein DI53_0004 [Sphingobacterium deserti]
MNKLLTIVFILSGMLVQAQHKESRRIANIKGIAVSSGIEATYVQSNRNEIIVEVEDPTHLKKLETVVENGTLIIRYKSNSNVRTRGTNRVTVYTSSSSLQRLKVTSSASLRVEPSIKTAAILVEISSSGKLYVANLATDKATIDASSSGQLNANMAATSLTINLSSSAQLHLLGSAKSATIAVSSSAQADLSEFEIKQAVVEVSSSAKAIVKVEEKLIADASSSGKIVYIGSPRSLTTDKSSSGTIRQQ